MAIVTVSVGFLITEPTTTIATVAVLLFTLPCQLQCVLQATTTSKNVVILGIIISLTNNLHFPKPDGALHVSLALPLDISTIPASVVTLNHLRLPASTSTRASNTAQLRNWRTSSPCGHLTCPSLALPLDISTIP